METRDNKITTMIKKTGKQKIIEHIVKLKWVPVVNRDICLLIRDLILTGEKSSIFNEALGVKIPPIGDAVVNNQLFSPIGSIENNNFALQKLAEKHGYRKLIEISQSCFKRANELHKYLESGDKAELIKRLKKFKKLYSRLTCYLLIVVFSEKYLERQVEKLITEKTGHKNERYFKSLVYVRKFNLATEELVAILELSKIIKTKKIGLKSNVAANLFKKHVKKFGWLGTRWQFERGWNIQDVKSRVEQYLKGDLEKKLNNVLETRKEAEIITEKFIKKYSLNSEEREFIDVVKEFVYLRTFRTESISRANFLARPLLREAHEKLAINMNDILFLSIDEIVDSLNGKIEYIKIIKERKKNYYIILCNDLIETFVGDEIRLVDELNLFNTNTSFGTKITGQIAWRGKVKGKVKIVRDRTDLNKVENGDVLVAAMTFPNYISAMERSAAFITDEGGILCHAAIVSRELQKPCIIGTKNATQVLKDGDTVEVDADKGVVRIIK